MSLSYVNQNDTEGDVETQIVLPILQREEYLGFPVQVIKSKEFLAGFDIGKGAKKRSGYVPDFCIYILSLPMLAVEAKSPNISVDQAWVEASLYAFELNKRYPANVDPCQLVFATNGVDFAAGRWNVEAPVVEGKIEALVSGSLLLDQLRSLLRYENLKKSAEVFNRNLRLRSFKRPFNQGEGPAIIGSKLESNTFAADLSPILRRYFSSRDQNNDPEIYKNAYVSSNEATSYDRILESFLVDRLSRSRSRTEVETTKKKADALSRRLVSIVEEKSPSGELQLITGGVGCGKSLFARRYKEYLQPPELSEASHWAFVDFNDASMHLSNATDWVCKSFVDSLIVEGAPIDLRNPDDQERVFATELADRQPYYDRMERASPGRGILELARDIEAWRLEPLKLAKGAARYLQGDRGDLVIVVFDNVDRRDVEDQLAAFQLALWFMAELRCLVILQMRDTTFESHKDEKPLDTYKTGQIFHISPPRFVDVVKRRLELSLAEIDKSSLQTVSFTTPGGVNLSYPKARAGDFLKGVYLELFQRTSNTSRILEALAGRNVRKALDMFLAILTSGHMPEYLIASVAAGEGVKRFPEYLVLKTLMRQDYRFTNEASGFTANILYAESNWERPSNFIVPEILFFLIDQRKVPGDNGQMGFVAFSKLVSRLESLGYVGADVFHAGKYLLSRELIEADSATVSDLAPSVCVKATASGWVHMRFLAGRSEYLTSILPTTPINDDGFAARIFDGMTHESRFGSISYARSRNLLENLLAYLVSQFDVVKQHPIYAQDEFKCGARYIIQKVSEVLNYERKSADTSLQLDWLDR